MARPGPELGPLQKMCIRDSSYIALATVVLNALVAAVLSLPLNAFASDRAGDETRAEDYI